MAYRTAGAAVTSLVAAGVALVLLGVPLPAQQQVFRVAADVVTLPVTVTARGDALVAGLRRDQFTVLEDGQAQTVSYFATGATPEVPVHLGLLLDTSGSMQRDLPSATSAAIRFVNRFDEARDVTFVDFSTRVRVSRFEPDSYPHLFARIRDNKADGYTALYDAVAMYLASAEDQTGQKVLLLYSDGADSRSSTSFSDVIEMLRLSQVIVYVIGYLENQPSSGQMVHQMRMNNIATQTGGAAFYPTGRDDLDRIYARILDELNGRYTLGYTSTNTTTDGRWRNIQVRVNAPDTRGLTVRTRPGYYAPVR